MNLFGFVLMVIFSALMVGLPRRIAGLAVFFAMIYITQGQQADIMGFHFTVIRLILLVGILRAFASGWFRELEYNSIDRAVVLFVTVLAIVFFIRCRTTDALVYSMGMDYNILLSHFLFRTVIRDITELEDFLKIIAIWSVPFAITMIMEGQNGHNIYAPFGGVGMVDMYRDGHYRASSAFRSPITAGTYGATLIPIYFGLYFSGRRRAVGLWGMAICFVIVFCARSSGPLLASACGMVGWMTWKFRRHIATIRNCFWGSIVVLHMIMKAPVWFLMGRISDIVGGGGYHRAEIVDACVNHFSRWCWFGTDNTADWMATQIYNGGADLTNEFVVYAVNGGLISVILFVLIIVRAFKFLGLARKELDRVKSVEEKMIWGLGCSIFGTMVNFFSVSYFDQIHVLWHFLLASAASCSFSALYHPDEYAEDSGSSSGEEGEDLSLEKVEKDDNEIVVETY